MYRLCWLIALNVFFLYQGFGQELNATVSINYSRIGNNHQEYFRTLENSLREFINNTSWSGRNFPKQERIDCVFLFNISGFNNNTVTGSLQVQSTRPVFQTNYSTPIVNLNDRDVVFTYNEFETLSYNVAAYDSNLVSIVGFYANVIIALDRFSFDNQDFDVALENAALIVNAAQQSNYRGWKQGDGSNTRFSLVNELNQGGNKPFLESLYSYHLDGLDKLVDDELAGRSSIYKAFVLLDELNRAKANTYLMRIFFDAKTEEVMNLYLGNHDVNKKEVISILNRLSPLNSSKWNSM